VTFVSPDWYFFGVNPNNAPAAFDFAMRTLDLDALLEQI
jgi:hypothetical protein